MAEIINRSNERIKMNVKKLFYISILIDIYYEKVFFSLVTFGGNLSNGQVEIKDNVEPC
jgi:hypothetical protein